MNLGNSYYINGLYKKAIQEYSYLLTNPELGEQLTYNTLSNRSAAYIKIGEYSLAVNDCIKVLEHNPQSAKAWGRLGASLYGLNKKEESLKSYKKAHELEKQEIYLTMIKKIELENIKLNDTFFKVPMVNDLSTNLIKTIMNDSSLMNKLLDPKFQEKVLSFENNPLEAFKDNDIMEVMKTMMMNIKL